MITFTKWIENLESQITGSKNVVLNFLKDELNINDEDLLLQLNTLDVSPEILSKLTQRGIIANNPEIKDLIRNGITIQELIQKLNDIPH